MLPRSAKTSTHSHRKHTYASRGYMGYITSDGDLYCPNMHAGIDKKSVLRTERDLLAQPFPDELWADSLRSKRIRYSNDDIGTSQLLTSMNNALFVPITVDDELVGQIGVADKEGGFTQEDVKLLESVARQLEPVYASRNKMRKNAAERGLMEHQLREAQKMEAVGRLAGGVAHDFNNLLQVISGYSDFALEAIPKHHSSAADLRQVREAAYRGTQLVRQLLAFGRKQQLDMKVIDLAGVAAGIVRMFRSTLGEDVKIDFTTEPDGCIIRGDEGQIEQVIMNLCMNSRDAMPQGGLLRLSIRQEYVPLPPSGADNSAISGKVVVLEVSDTGKGMSQEIIERIYEPFFSTKEETKGTGLGMATVYGIVKQHGGSITIGSEVGKGTTVTVLFPIVEGKIEKSAGNSSTEYSGGSETIVIAEDEAGVKRFAERILKDAGYVTLTASDGTEVLELFEIKGTKIDLVITDMVMPNMSGMQLYEQVHRRFPKVQFLFATGYNAIMADGEAQTEDFVVLHKPFKKEELLSKIREILD